MMPTQRGRRYYVRRALERGRLGALGRFGRDGGAQCRARGGTRQPHIAARCGTQRAAVLGAQTGQAPPRVAHSTPTRARSTLALSRSLRRAARVRREHRAARSRRSPTASAARTARTRRSRSPSKSRPRLARPLVAHSPRARRVRSPTARRAGFIRRAAWRFELHPRWPRQTERAVASEAAWRWRTAPASLVAGRVREVAALPPREAAVAARASARGAPPLALSRCRVRASWCVITGSTGASFLWSIIYNICKMTKVHA